MPRSFSKSERLLTQPLDFAEIFPSAKGSSRSPWPHSRQVDKSERLLAQHLATLWKGFQVGKAPDAATWPHSTQVSKSKRPKALSTSQRCRPAKGAPICTVLQLAKASHAPTGLAHSLASRKGSPRSHYAVLHSVLGQTGFLLSHRQWPPRSGAV